MKQQFQQPGATTSQNEAGSQTPPPQKRTSKLGEYIDFEEVK